MALLLDELFRNDFITFDDTEFPLSESNVKLTLNGSVDVVPLLMDVQLLLQQITAFIKIITTNVSAYIATIT